MMKNCNNDIFARYPVLRKSQSAIEAAAQIMIETFENGKNMFVAGNGGSGADGEHIAGELLKGFMCKRELKEQVRRKFTEFFGEAGGDLAGKLQCGLPCISLLSHPALNFAFANDVDPDLGFAQQLWALGREGDLFLGISTSGNAKNLEHAFKVAKVSGIQTILMTGNRHGRCEQYVDLVLPVDESETFKIQELHLPVYHWLCQVVEEHFFL